MSDTNELTPESRAASPPASPPAGEIAEGINTAAPPAIAPPPPGGGQSMLDHALAAGLPPGPTQHGAPSTGARRIGQRNADVSVGGSTKDDHDMGQASGPRSRRPVVLAAVATLAAILIALAVVLGRFNAQRLAIHCEPNRIVATAGRSFPPWGESPLEAPEFAAIPIPKNTECTSRTTSNRVELEDWYLAALMEQATARLSTRLVADVDLASKQLEQALLLTRTATRRDARKEVDRLVGDVEYWRAAAHLKASADALLGAAAQFDTAAKKRPRHATDAAEWATHVRRLVDVLRAGPTDGRGTSLSTGAGPSPGENPETPTTSTTPRPSPGDGSAAPSAPELPATSSPSPATGGVLL